ESSAGSSARNTGANATSIPSVVDALTAHSPDRICSARAPRKWPPEIRRSRAVLSAPARIHWRTGGLEARGTKAERTPGQDRGDSPRNQARLHAPGADLTLRRARVHARRLLDLEIGRASCREREETAMT